MIDLCRFSVYKRENRHCRGGLSNLKHTDIMQEADSTISHSLSPVKRPWAIKDLTGLKFGMWTVLRIAGTRRFKSRTALLYYECRCDCGRIRTISGGSITSGLSASCGCQTIIATKKSNTTHGKSKTREYRTWAGIKERCYSPKKPVYKHYGGRGIKVCDRWLESFENFFEDMGLKPSPKHSIERKNTNGNYEPSNCVWATQLEQMHNFGKNVNVEINGEIKCIAEWARGVNMKEATFRARIRAGWDPIVALSKPVRDCGR